MRSVRNVYFAGSAAVSYPRIISSFVTRFARRSPFDVFYYRPYRSYYVYGYPKREEMGFLEGCFSYIFGDGDPNAQLEEVRIRR